MANKGNRRAKKRKISAKGLFLSVLLLAGIIVLGMFYYIYHSDSGSFSLDYEDASGGSSELNSKISMVDHAIYESLYNGGVDEKDVYFSEVKPGNAKGYEWDFTELTINIPDRKTALHLGDKINKELSALKPDVASYREDIPDQEIVYNIFSLELYTHKIRLTYKKTGEQPYKDLPKIAIVIDDVGNDYKLANSFMNIGLPLTLSILSSSTYAEDIAEKAKEKGFEVILHLPMEPKNYPAVNPGPDALLTKMDENQIRAVLDKNLEKIPGVAGVNNHMGSYFTEREDKMTYVLKDLKKRGLFYLDSRTTSNSVGFRLAGEMGVPAAKKSVFLDNDLSPKSIKYQLERLVRTARYSGEAIGIGHPHEATLSVLKDQADMLKADFRVVPVSELVK